MQLFLTYCPVQYIKKNESVIFNIRGTQYYVKEGNNNISKIDESYVNNLYKET